MSRTTTKITDFTKGMAADLRSSSGFARLQHFKAFPHRLVPQFGTIADETTTFGIKRFAFAPWSNAGAYDLFGLGNTAGHVYAAVYIKNGGGTSDPTTGGWTTPVNGEGTSGVSDSRIFFPYKNYLYFLFLGTELWRYGDLTGTPSISSFQTIAYSNVAEPVHHPADDCAYFFFDNKVYRLNGTTWNGLVLTLPDNMIITSADADGDYLHIACKSKSGLGNSWSYKWDRDSSLSTVTAKVDWGRGDLLHIAKLQGTIVGVTDFFTSSILGHRTGKLVIKAVVGDVAKVVGEYPTTGLSFFDANKYVSDDKLHFAAELARDGSFIHGVFSVDALGQLRVEISEAEADGSTQGQRYQGIFKTAEFWWLAHSNDGSVNRTDDQNTYTYTSILETNIIGTPDVQSQFVGASVSFEPLPSGATVTLKCRKVGETNWTTIKAVTTTAETKLYATKDSNSQARSFYELQYRIESTGGAVITGLEWTHETNDQKPYGRS